MTLIGQDPYVDPHLFKNLQSMPDIGQWAIVLARDIASIGPGARDCDYLEAILPWFRDCPPDVLGELTKP